MAAPTAPTPGTVGLARRSPDPLRVAATVFAVALLVHGADHLRRGMDVVTPEVFWLGNVQLVLSLVTLVLVFRGHRWAPAFAVGIGFASAIGFSAAHLLPHWSAFSDSFTGAHHAPRRHRVLVDRGELRDRGRPRPRHHRAAGAAHGARVA